MNTRNFVQRQSGRRPGRTVVLLGFAILSSLLAVMASPRAYAVTSEAPPQVSAGYDHTCLIKSDGSLACWGLDGNGQATPPAGTFTQVSAGMYHTCGVASDGAVACWGKDDAGQATPPAGLFTQVSAGGSHTCGIKSGGTLACWGWNYYGQSTPPAGAFTQVSAGMYHTCAVGSGGAVTCWGWNNAGQASPAVGDFTQVGAGEMHTCGLKIDGSLACWGLDDAGQASPPAEVFTQVSAGANHSCGLRSDKSLACWGENAVGQAEPPAGLFDQVSAGGRHSCALKSDDSLVCWGSNIFGQSPVLCATPPSIAEQPKSATRTVGQTVTFSVGVNGTGVSYQWRKDGSDIAGANSASYTLPSLALTDAATYDVVVSNACGMVTSAAAVLGVTEQPPCTPHFPEYFYDALTVCPDWLPDGVMGATYDQLIWAWNYVHVDVLLPYLWDMWWALPPGLTMDLASGRLSGTPVAPGTYPFTVYVHDSHYADGGDFYAYKNYTLNIMGTNHAPNFTPGGNITVPEDTVYSAIWATDITTGGKEDIGQTLTFLVTNDNNALFSTQPTLALDGTLSFVLAPDSYGVAMVSVSLKDNGGTAFGGSDTSSTVTFKIDVMPVEEDQTGPVFTVNTTVWTTDHACTDKNCTLREAIEAANNYGGNNPSGPASTIELATGAVYTIDGVDNTSDDWGPSGLPPILANITINGHGASIRRSDNAPSTRLIDVGGGFLTLNEVALDNGKAGPTKYGSSIGGAILDRGQLTIKNSYLANNAADRGGAIFNPGGPSARIYNSTFFANSGGAIHSDGALDLYSNTFLNNIGGMTSAVRAYSYTSYLKINLYNNLFASSNASVPLCDIAAGSGILAVGGNLATDNSCAGSGVTTYAALKTITPPAYNDGPTRNIALQVGSSAIDVGNATACQNADIAGRDQRGQPRFIDGNGDSVAQCDVGAFEYRTPAPQLPPPPQPETDAPQVSILLSPATPDGNNGWYRSPVAVQPWASDASPVIELRCALNPSSPPATFEDLPEEICPFLGGANTSTDGEHAFYAAAMDVWGNKSAVVSTEFRIDATPPVITCPVDGPFLLHSGEHTVGPAAVDAGVSGLDEVAGTLSGILATDSIGPQTLDFTAVDLAGNSASQACTYEVIFDFDGFYPPVEPAPSLNDARAGRSVPLKFSLAGDQGLGIIAAGYPASQAVTCDTQQPTGDLEPAERPGKSELSYASETGWYHYGWQTQKPWSGTCRVLVIRLIDGTEHLAVFKFK